MIRVASPSVRNGTFLQKLPCPPFKRNSFVSPLRQSTISRAVNETQSNGFGSFYSLFMSGILSATLLCSCTTSLTVSWDFGLATDGAEAKLDPVNRPELLPEGQTTVIDVAGFLTPGEEDRLKTEIDSMEKETGVKLRVLAQNYPETPGLAVRDYWAVDDDTVVFVADPTFGGILNFNVGSNIDLRVPRSFWSRLTGKFGNKFYWQEKGESAAIVNAVYAIDACLHEPPSRLQCNSISEN